MVETRSSMPTASSSAAARSTSQIPVSPNHAKLLVSVAGDLVGQVSGVLQRHKLTQIEVVEPAQIIQRLSTREFHCSIVEFHDGSRFGMDLPKQLTDAGYATPVIFLASRLPLHAVVRGMRRGAFAFVEKDRCEIDLPGLVYEALQRSGKGTELDQVDTATQRQFASLTERERMVLRMLVDGAHNRDVAATLNIGLRTVERDRRGLMEKMDAKTLPDLVRKAVIVYGQGFLYGLQKSPEGLVGSEAPTASVDQERIDSGESQITPPRSDFSS